MYGTLSTFFFVLLYLSWFGLAPFVLVVIQSKESINQSNLFLYCPKSQITICRRRLHKLHGRDILCPSLLVRKIIKTLNGWKESGKNKKPVRDPQRRDPSPSDRQTCNRCHRCPTDVPNTTTKQSQCSDNPEHNVTLFNVWFWKGKEQKSPTKLAK